MTTKNGFGGNPDQNRQYVNRALQKKIQLIVKEKLIQIYSVSQKKWTKVEYLCTIQYTCRITIVSQLGQALSQESFKCTYPHTIRAASTFQQVPASSLEPGQLIWMDTFLKAWLW